MARKIDPDNLKPQDKSYLEQRPWLITELETETGRKFEDMDFGLPDEGDSTDGAGDANTDKTMEAELAAVRRENASLREELQKTQEQLAEAHDDLAKLTESTAADEDDPDEPYEQWDYSDLQAEVKERGLKPEDRSTEGLIKALEADDAENASEGDAPA